MTTYLCQQCYRHSAAETVSLESGNILTCQHCGQETVITLWTPRVREIVFAAFEVCREVAEPPYADSDLGSLFKTLHRRAVKTLKGELK